MFRNSMPTETVLNKAIKPYEINFISYVVYFTI